MIFKLGVNCDMKKAVKMAKRGFPVVIPSMKNGKLHVSLWNMDKDIENIVKNNLPCCDVQSLSIAKGDLPMVLGV